MKTISEEIKNKGFRPSPIMLLAAGNVFAAMAWVEVIRPVVEGYQREILNRHKWHIAKEWSEKRGLPDKIILEPNRAYLLEDEDFNIYLKECHEARNKAGLKVENDDFCPLLVSERLLSEAKRGLIDVMEPTTGIEFDDLFHHGLEDYNKYIDITLRLLAPYLKTK